MLEGISTLSEGAGWWMDRQWGKRFGNMERSGKDRLGNGIGQSVLVGKRDQLGRQNMCSVSKYCHNGHITFLNRAPIAVGENWSM